jgi:glycosyltransferase involved in cell wall biosynthesis
MRILHVVPSFGFGGMEKIICAIIENTAIHYEHIVLVLDGCAHAAAWIKNTDTRIVTFDKPRSRRLFFSALYDAVRMSHPDLLMTYNWGATDAIWLGRLAGISKIIHHEHGFNVDEGLSTAAPRDLIRFFVYRLTSKIIVVSHELEEMLLKKFRVSEGRVVRISNGVDTSFYSPNEVERQQVRASLGYKSSDLVLGFSGRLDPVKNLDLLLNIFKSSNPRDYPFRLLVVGDGPDRLRLEERCHAMGIAPYVTFAGQQLEIRPYLRAMDVFLLTSLREQMPLTVLEAMAVGMPVVVTSVGELPQIVEEGVEGFVRDLNAPLETFVQLFQPLLCQATRSRMGDAARRSVLEKFNREGMLKSYTRVISEFE